MKKRSPVLFALFAILFAGRSLSATDPAPEHTTSAPPGTDQGQGHEFGMDLLTSGSLTGENRANFIAALFKQDALQAYRLAFQMNADGKLSDSDRRAFGESVYLAITTETYARLDPAFLQKLIAGDDVAQERACKAFLKMTGDSQTIAWFGIFLESQNPQVQFLAMEGLWNFSLTADVSLLPKPNPNHADPNHPDLTPYPAETIAPYQQWVKTWLDQHPSASLPASGK